jgi:hypothetical protein
VTVLPGSRGRGVPRSPPPRRSWSARSGLLVRVERAGVAGRAAGAPPWSLRLAGARRCGERPDAAASLLGARPGRGARARSTVGGAAAARPPRRGRVP